MSDLDVLRASALLHDVGKLECWAERKPWSKHVYYTYEFVKECLGDEVAEHAMRHHSSPHYPKDYQPKDRFDEIICLADNIASGADRPEETVHGAPLPSPPIELSHVLSSETVRNRLNAADLSYIYQETLSILREVGKKFGEDPRETYFKIYCTLDEKSKLRYVPADTRSPVNDVSLWNHMKLTAAFATCIYLGGWRGSRPERYEFSLLSGDADWISKFIGEALRLPDLNARSELIKEATSAAEDSLRNFLGPECILFAAGGSILAVCPPNLVSEAARRIKKSFEEGSDGMVSITVTHVEARGDEFQKNFSGVWKRARQDMRLKKSRRLPAMKFALDEGVEVCDVCRMRAGSHEDPERILPFDASPRHERLCDVCWSLREKGKGAWLNYIKGGSNFVACIKADGDNVGALLSGRGFKEVGKSGTPSRIAALSDLIHKTCEDGLRRIIYNFDGKIIYAGGDDLLAFTPGESALLAAREISLVFMKEMAGKCTMSAGVAIFHYKLPVYTGLEAANFLISEVKRKGKGKIAYAVVGSTGLTDLELKKNMRIYAPKQIGKILEIIKFLQRCEISASQLWRIALVASSDRFKAEGLIRNLMGKFKIGLVSGRILLNYIRSQLFQDAFSLYSLFKVKR